MNPVQSTCDTRAQMGILFRLCRNVNRPFCVYRYNIETGLLARTAKCEALQNARELCYEWRIVENDARTLAYEVAAAAAPRRGIRSW